MCWTDFCKYFDEVGVCDPMYVPKLLLEEVLILTSSS
jgi:hypothetical protein